MNEMKPWTPVSPDVVYKTAKVTFPAFDTYKARAQEIADYISDIKVTEENVKDVKKDLAAARKITDELTRRKTAIKKEILSDFNVFDNEVKELVAIIDAADTNLRGKVRELEELERERKKKEIHDLFDKRVGHYQIGKLLPKCFDRWWHEDLANKSKSMRNIEDDMIDWLEQTEKDITTLSTMDQEYLVEYLASLDLALTIQTVNSRMERRSKVSGSPQSDAAKKSATFRVFGEKDIALTEMLLNSNHIDFTRE